MPHDFFCRHTVSIWRSISQIEEFVGRHDDTQLLPHHPIHDRGSWHHRHRVADDMFVSCMACRHQWGTVGKYRLYSPLGSQRAGIKKRNYEEYKKYKKEDERGRLCCIDPAEQSRDALGTLAALFFLPSREHVKRKSNSRHSKLQPPGRPPDWRCKQQAGEKMQKEA